MCIKTIYHNSYTDGTHDRTERVESCSPGFMCTRPQIDHIDRAFNCTKSELDRASSVERRGRPATPRSISPPGSRGSDSDGVRKQHRRRNSIYKTDPITIGTSKPYAPTPPSPIAFARSSTMPHGFASQPTRGRAPIIVTDPAPRYTQTSATIPIGPVEILHSSPRRRASHRRESSGAYLSPDLRRHSRSPQGYASAEDERERAERRRRRHASKAQAALFSSSVPTPYINNDAYASSFGSSSYASSRDSSLVDPSPAAAAVEKKLRFEDEARARQNDKIRSRPKLARADTLKTRTPLQGEVKSILKNSTSTSPSGRARASSRSEMDEELYRSMEGLGISERETSAQRRAREEREMEKSRLKGRFELGSKRQSMPVYPGPPARSYTVGSGGRTRQEFFYPEQRTYRTQPQWP